MNNNVKTDAGSEFFTKARVNNQIRENLPYRKHDSERKQFLDEITRNDARIQIDDSVKDFSKIKKMIERVPEMDNRDKVARLKKEIQEGRYQIDYDALADKILGSRL